MELVVSHRQIETNGIDLHVAECGRGPLVVCCHGFPELWFSWRHQLPALAAAGYRAVAPDQRGYGRSERPEAIEDYDIVHLGDDILGLIDVLGEERAVVVGHDWGAMVAWYLAQAAPERLHGVAALSVPFWPRTPRPPTEMWKELFKDRFFYMLHFQTPGVADAQLDADPGASLRFVFRRVSADVFDGTADVPSVPRWLSEEDFAVYEAEFRRRGSPAPSTGTGTSTGTGSSRRRSHPQGRDPRRLHRRPARPGALLHAHRAHGGVGAGPAGAGPRSRDRPLDPAAGSGRDQRGPGPLPRRPRALPLAVEVLASRVLLRPVDFGRSYAFYAETLGLHPFREFAGGAVFFLGGGYLEVSGRGGPPAAAPDQISLWLQVRDVDAEWARLAAAGVDQVEAPVDQSWGLREARLRDPDGVLIVLVQVPGGHPLRRDTRG
jgi:Predicted hydrolases or acyltransferases (alpha/beta hydrolase superfamily)